MYTVYTQATRVGYIKAQLDSLFDSYAIFFGQARYHGTLEATLRIDLFETNGTQLELFLNWLTVYNGQESVAWKELPEPNAYWRGRTPLEVTVIESAEHLKQVLDNVCQRGYEVGNPTSHGRKM